MKIFLFSRRFLIGLFLAMVLHVGYLTWDFWEIYKDDMVGKGIPGFFQFQWVQAQAEVLASLCFLPSFLLAIIYYSHYQFRKRKETYRPFSFVNWTGVIIFSVLVFIYNEYVATTSYSKSMNLLMAFVYARPGEKFDSASVINYNDNSQKNPRIMSLQELFHAKDSLINSGPTKSNEIFYNTIPTGKLEKIKLEIGHRLAWPFAFIVFYIIGVLLAVSFYRTYAIIPLLIGWFGVFYLFYIGNNFLEIKYKYGKVGWFWGVGGITLLFGILGIIWYLMVRQRINKIAETHVVEKVEFL